MRYCSDCGNEVEKATRFCSECGIALIKKEVASLETAKPKQKWFFKTILILFILGIVGVGGFFAVIFFDSATTGGSFTGSVLNEIYPPNPKVIDVDCGSYGTGFLDMDSRMKVEVTVQNMGGGGNIRVTGKLDQSDTAYDASDSKMIYMSKNQVQTVTFDFDSSGFRNAQCLGYAYAS